MRVLVLHSRYASGSISGENRVAEDEIRLLQEAGHDVLAWLPSADGLHGLQLAAVGATAVWSRRSVTAVRRLSRTFAPDVTHCHNLFPLLSPAIIRTAAAEGPVVLTLHNHRLLCLPATFLRNGLPCERCLGHFPWAGIRHRCYRNSVPASAALASSLGLHRVIATFERISRFVAVSKLLRDKHVEGGFPPARISVKPNFAWPVERRNGTGKYFLFLGRLSPERGIEALVRAWADVPATLVVAGDGPAAAQVRTLAGPNVSLRGAVLPRDVPRLLSGARALVFPTLACEGCPRAILEAYAAGVPVLASNRGSVPELVDDGITGLLLSSLDGPDVLAAAERLLDDSEAERMGEAAFRRWRDRHSPEHALADLETAYAGLRGGIG
jgi:glycosyltransferase involved in cell wall biosynthesis